MWGGAVSKEFDERPHRRPQNVPSWVNVVGKGVRTKRCCLCRVRRSELSRPDCPTSVFCVGVRPAVAPAVPAPPDTLRRRTHLSGRLSSHRHTRRDKTVLSGSCRCELDDCSGRVQTSDFLSATVLSCREPIQFTPPKRTRHRQDSFVVCAVAV